MLCSLVSPRPAASELLSLAAQVAEGGIQVGHVGSEYLWHGWNWENLR